MHSHTFCLDVYYFIFLIVKMPGAHMPGAHMTGADMTGAYIPGAHIPRPHMTGAHMPGARTVHPVKGIGYKSRRTLCLLKTQDLDLCMLDSDF
jgi:hypothetical protein